MSELSSHRIEYGYQAAISSVVEILSKYNCIDLFYFMYDLSFTLS